MTVRYSATIDVPDLSAGLAFYGAVLGFKKIAAPIEGIWLIGVDKCQLSLLARPEGSAATTGHATAVRDYSRHWTPIHLDFYVADINPALANIEKMGGKIERTFATNNKHGAVAFCSDPFGHGFCLIEKTPPSQ